MVPPKPFRNQEKVLKGYWSLDNITYSEKGTFNVKLLNDTSKECFEGNNLAFHSQQSHGNIYCRQSQLPQWGPKFYFRYSEMNPESVFTTFVETDTKKRKIEKQCGLPSAIGSTYRQFHGDGKWTEKKNKRGHWAARTILVPFIETMPEKEAMR